MEHSTANHGADAVRARFAIVTPMFLGGARREAESIRPPSVKGALRFWWRALNWGRVRANNPTDITALQALHREEARLFGVAGKTVDNRQIGGQGVFLLAVKASELSKWEPLSLDQKRNPGHIYTLGQGLCRHERDSGSFVLTREALGPAEFEAHLRFRPHADSKDRESVIEALRAFGLLGGLGSKTRRGWGSVSLLELSIQEKPQTLPNSLEEYAGALRKLLAGNPGDKTLPCFTAFSESTEIRVTHRGNDPLRLLETVGNGLMRYRSNGRCDRNGKRWIGNEQIANPESLTFWADHNLMFDALTKNIKEMPKRLVFGYPYNVQFSNNRGEIQLKRTTNKGYGDSGDSRKNNGYERRASPLFIHIHALNSGVFFVVQSMIPAAFLPAGEEIVVQRKFGGEAGWLAFQPDWNVLTDYLEKTTSLATITAGGKQ
jgi:CRISPR-associated protein Cmr1